MDSSQPSNNFDMSQFTSQSVDPQDLKAFDFNNNLNSPITGNGKAPMVRVTSSMTSPISALSQDLNDDQLLMRPSHDYGRFKQQTGLPMLNPGQGDFSGYNTGIFESQMYDGLMNMPMDPNFEAYLEMSANNDFIDPTAIMKQEEAQANIRYFPGMHQQAAIRQQALMKQRREQEVIQQQQPQSSRRSGSSQPLDPRTEETISRVMNEIRRSSTNATDGMSPSNNSLLPHIIKAKKDEDDMDDDEKLLNSEEGKKLSSKERRQLRNKVSARAFRSRRKEYIGQLEGELAGKNNECVDLQRQNHMLIEENARFRSLAEKLLAHPAFHPFLDELSRDPDLADSLSKVASSSQQVQQIPQLPKDVDPFANSQHYVPQNNSAQIGMTMIPEIPVDLSSLNIGGNNWNNSQSSGMGLYQQPQVFAVTELPQGPSEPIDFEALSGKRTETFEDNEKTIVPEIESLPSKVDIVKEECIAVSEPEIECPFDENDPTVALFAVSKSTPKESNNEISQVTIEKPTTHFDIVVPTEQESQQNMSDLERSVARLDAAARRIESLLY